MAGRRAAGVGRRAAGADRRVAGAAMAAARSKSIHRSCRTAKAIAPRPRAPGVVEIAEATAGRRAVAVALAGPLVARSAEAAGIHLAEAVAATLAVAEVAATLAVAEVDAANECCVFAVGFSLHARRAATLPGPFFVLALPRRGPPWPLRKRWWAEQLR